MKDAVDFSDARPSGAELQLRGLDALVYTGNARPDQAYIDDLRNHGVLVTFIQETTSTRSQQGFPAGVYDCNFAELRSKQRGHTGSIAVVCSDGSWVDAWDCSEYGRGWASVATLPYFAYGSVGCAESFGYRSSSLGTWIPETWGKGSLITQKVGASPVAGTDYNTVHADYTGATTPIIITPDSEEEMLIHNKATNDMAIIFASHRPRKILSINDYHSGCWVSLDADAWQQYWDDAMLLYQASLTTSTGTTPAGFSFTGTAKEI